MAEPNLAQLRRAVDAYKKIKGCPAVCPIQAKGFPFLTSCLPRDRVQKDRVKRLIKKGECAEINKYGACLTIKSKELEGVKRKEFSGKFLDPLRNHVKKNPQCKTTFGRGFGGRFSMGEVETAIVALENLRDSIKGDI